MTAKESTKDKGLPDPAGKPPRPLYQSGQNIYVFFCIDNNIIPGTETSIHETHSNQKTHSEQKTHSIENNTDSYFYLSGTALTNLIKQFLNAPVRVEGIRRGQVTSSEDRVTKEFCITYKGNGGEYKISVKREEKPFVRRVQNGTKILNFLLEKLNAQNCQEATDFLLSELVEAGIYANLDSAYRGLKNVLDKLMHIYIEGTVTTYEKRKRKEKSNVKTALIAQWRVTYKDCSVVLSPLIRNSVSYITILPNWSYTLPSENSYLLLDYIYYLARQNADKIRERNYFTIRLETIRRHLGLIAPADVHKSNYNKLIVEPIDAAITAIEKHKARKNLMITPMYNHDYKNIYEYLDGYVKIILTGEAFEYMAERALESEKQRKAVEKRIETAKVKALAKKLEIVDKPLPSA